MLPVNPAAAKITPIPHHLAEVSVHVPTIGPTNHTAGRPDVDWPYKFQLLMSTAPSPPGARGAPVPPLAVPVTTLIVACSPLSVFAVPEEGFALPASLLPLDDNHGPGCDCISR